MNNDKPSVGFSRRLGGLVLIVAGLLAANLTLYNWWLSWGPPTDAPEIYIQRSAITLTAALTFFAAAILLFCRRDTVALVFALSFPTLATWLYFVVLAGRESMQLAYAACKVLQFGFPLAWVWLVQKQAIRLTPPTQKGVGFGLVFGLAVLAVMLGAYYGFLKGGVYLADMPVPLWQKITEIGCGTPVKFFGLAIFLSILHSMFEEYYWRWFVFGQLRRSLPLFWAMLISSLGFMAHHIIVLAAYMKAEHFWTATLFFSLCIAAGGMVWAWLYHKTGSLYGPWLSHLLVDAGLMWIGFDLCRGYWP